METQTIINAKLEKAESFLQQIPEDIRTLFHVNVFSYDYADFVGLSFRLPGDNYNFVATEISRVKHFSVEQISSQTVVCIKTAGSHVTLYNSGEATITLF